MSSLGGGGFLGAGGGFTTSFLSASAISSGFFSSGLASGCGFTWGTGGAASAFAASISGFSETFGAGSFTGFGSGATFSTSGFGASALGAVLIPAVICENSLEEITSTGSASAVAASNGFAENEIRPHAKKAA